MKLSISIVILAGMMAGCTSSMKAGDLQQVQTTSENERAGNAYLLRGWIGIFSAGIDNLTEQINESGVRANVYQDEQWRALAKQIREQYAGRSGSEPLVLIGHSYGADDAVRVARELQKDNLEVELLVTLDPVTPPLVPDNVKRCVNIYRSNGVWDAMPWLRGVPLETESTFAGQIENFNIRENRKDLFEPGTDHFNIEKKQSIHNEIIKQVLASCPPRQVWVAMQTDPQQPTRAGASIAPGN